jgi:hypothetical protein
MHGRKKFQLLDETYNIEKNYFYKPISEKKLTRIRTFLEGYFETKQTDSESLHKFFTSFEKILHRGEDNIKKVREM